MGWAPGSLARLANIRPPPTRFEPERGGLGIPEGIFTRPAPLAHGVVFDLGNIGGSKVTRAHQAGQLHGVTTIGFDLGACPRLHGAQEDDRRWTDAPSWSSTCVG